MNITINPNRINSFQNISVNGTNISNQNDKNNKINNSNTNQNKKESSLMKNLLEQKQSLNEEKQNLMAKEDMDAKEKKSKIDELNKKIQEIDSQIQQLKIQEKQEELEKQQEEISKQKVDQQKYNNSPNEKGDIIVSASLSELIKYNSSQKTMHLLKDSKNRQQIEAGYIKSNDDPNSYDNKHLLQISKSIASLDIAINKKTGDLAKSAERIKSKTDLALKQMENNDDDISDDEAQKNNKKQVKKANDANS